MFKRRDARSWLRVVGELFYPRGGWKRAGSYVMHRLRRLPDSPERIARGIFAGVFISFTPLFGLHFVGAALVALAYRGNILAALLATFFGNPLTFPLIATSSLETGYWLLGSEYRLPLSLVMPTFGDATAQLSRNVIALITGGTADWGRLVQFFHKVYLPYLIGSIIPGVLVGLIVQYASLPLIRAYHALRLKRLAERAARREEVHRRQLAQAEALDLADIGAAPTPAPTPRGRKRR